MTPIALALLFFFDADMNGAYDASVDQLLIGWDVATQGDLNRFEGTTDAAGEVAFGNADVGWNNLSWTPPAGPAPSGKVGWWSTTATGVQVLDPWTYGTTRVQIGLACSCDAPEGNSCLTAGCDISGQCVDVKPMKDGSGCKADFGEGVCQAGVCVEPPCVSDSGPVGGGGTPPVQDDNAGTWTDDYDDDGGIAPEALGMTVGVEVDGIGQRVVMLDCADEGLWATTIIAPSSFSGWGAVELGAQLPGGAALEVWALDADRDVVYGAAGATGTFAARPAPLVLSPTADAKLNRSASLGFIDASATRRLRILVRMQRGTLAPFVDALRVRWTPRSVVTVRVAAPVPTSAPTGDVMSFRGNVAVSYVDAVGLLIRAALPEALTNPRSQDQSVSVVGGTPGWRLSADGWAIEWYFAKRPAGDTFSVSWQVRTKNGLVDRTVFRSRLEVSADNATTASTQPFDTEVRAAPSPDAHLYANGTLSIGGVRYADGGSEVTFAGSVANWGGSVGVETIFDAVVRVDASELVAALQGGYPTTSGARIEDANISAGGRFTASGVTLPNGFYVAPNSVYWLPGDLEPGESFSYSFSVRLSAEAPAGPLLRGQVLGACASLASAWPPRAALSARGCDSFTVHVPDDPRVGFAVGEEVRGAISINPGDDLPGSRIGFGEPFALHLRAGNEGVSALGDVVMLVQVPSGGVFREAWLPPEARGTIWYYTGPDGASADPLAPPGFDAETGELDWSSAAPADPASVSWVAFRVPRLGSAFLPEVGVPSAVVGQVLLTAKAPEEDCPEEEIAFTSTGLVHVYEYTRPTVGTSEPVPEAMSAVNAELSRVAPSVPVLDSSTLWASRSPVTAGDVVTFAFDVRNASVSGMDILLDDALGLAARIDLPTVVANGRATPLRLAQVRAPGGTVRYDLPRGIDVTYPAALVPWQSQRIEVDAVVPNGLIDGTSFAVAATLDAHDDACGAVRLTRSASVEYDGSPELQVRKTSDFGYGQQGTLVTWTLSWSNTGRTPSTGTWVVDRVPPGLSVTRVEVPPGGEVWLSTRPPGSGVPAGLLPDEPFDQAMVLSAFTRVDDAADGEVDGWVKAKLDAPLQWVALRVDDQGLEPPQVTTGTLHQARLQGKVTAPNNGDVVANEAAIFSNELLFAIAQKALFTVTGRPGLRLALACDDIAAARETLDCTLRYDNDSANPDTGVVVRLELPEALGFVSAGHTWNDVYLKAHPGAAAPPILSEAGEVEATIGALAPLEGGTLAVKLRVEPWVGSGTLVAVGGRGEAVGPDGSRRLAYASEPVLVENADLYLRALSDNPAPRSSERFHVTMLVTNEGAHDARASGLVVTLPAALVYVPGTTLILAAPWGAAPGTEPKVSGRTLTWASPDAALTWDGGEAGRIPGLGPAAMVVFEVEVAAGTLPGSSLLTCGEVTTATGEDPDFDNEACVEVVTPLPDPWVEVSGPDVRNIDARVAWTVSYGNRQNEVAGGVVVIDSLPDLAPPDGVPDVTYLSHTVASGEVVWLHQGAAGAAPAFDRESPASGGWVRSPAAGKPVSHIAFVAGNLAPYTAARSVVVAAQLTRPDGQAIVPGSAFVNRALVSMRPGYVDAFGGNNAADATVRVPGIDVGAEATCAPVGRVPGARVGDLVKLEIGFAALGSERVHGLRVVDVLPPELELVGEPGPVRIVDANGIEVAPIGVGGERLARPVAWTREGGTYRLGEVAEASATWYRRVGLKPGDHGVLELTARVKDDVATRTTIVRRAEVWSDYVEGWQAGVDAPESYLDNNVRSCDFTVYRADLMVEKSADNLDGASDAVVDGGDVVRYRLAYDNIGDATAEGVFMEDAIPEGLDLIVGSVSGVGEGDATVRYSNDGGASWGYVSTVPAGSPDPAITHVRVEWAAGMAAPLSGVFVQTTAADFERGTHVNTRVDPSGAVVSTGGNVCGTVTCDPVKCDYGTYIPDGGCCAVCRPSVETCAGGASVESPGCSGWYEYSPAWTGCIADDGCTSTCDYQNTGGVALMEAAPLPPAACQAEYGNGALLEGQPKNDFFTEAAAPAEPQSIAELWMRCVAEQGVETCASYQCPDAPKEGPCETVPLWEQCWDVPCTEGTAHSCSAIKAVDACYARYGIAMGVYGVCLEKTAEYYAPIYKAEGAVGENEAALQDAGLPSATPRPWEDPEVGEAERLADYRELETAMREQAASYKALAAQKTLELNPPPFTVTPLPMSIDPAVIPTAFADEATFWGYYTTVELRYLVAVGPGHMGVVGIRRGKEQAEIPGAPESFLAVGTWGSGPGGPTLTPIATDADGRIVAASGALLGFGPTDASGELRVWGRVNDAAPTDGTKLGRIFQFTPATGAAVALDASAFGLAPDAGQVVDVTRVFYVDPVAGDVLVEVQVYDRIECAGPTLEECLASGFYGTALPATRLKKAKNQLFIAKAAGAPQLVGDDVSLGPVNAIGAAWGYEASGRIWFYHRGQLDFLSEVPAWASTMLSDHSATLVTMMYGEGGGVPLGWRVYKKDDAGVLVHAADFETPDGCAVSTAGPSLEGGYAGAGWCSDWAPGEAFYVSDRTGFQRLGSRAGFEWLGGEEVRMVSDRIGLRRSTVGKNTQWGVISETDLYGPVALVPSPCVDCVIEDGTPAWSTTLRGASGGVAAAPGFFFWGETSVTDAQHLAPYLGTVVLGPRDEEAALAAEAAPLSKRRDQITSTLGKLDRQRVRLEQTEQEIQHYEQELDQLVRQRRELEDQISACNDSGSCSAEELQSLQDQLVRTNKDIGNVETTISELEQLRSDLEAAVAELEALEPGLLAELAQIEQRLAVLDVELGTLRERIATLEEEIASAEEIAKLSETIASRIAKDIGPGLETILALGIAVDTCDWLMPKDDCSPCLGAMCEATPDGLETWGNYPTWIAPRYLASPLGKVADGLRSLRREAPAGVTPTPRPEACGGPRACGKGAASQCAEECPRDTACERCWNGATCLSCLPNIHIADALPQDGTSQCTDVAQVLAPVYAQCLDKVGEATELCDWTRPPDCDPADACGIGTYTSPVFPADEGERVLEWKRATVEDAAELEGTALRYSVIDGDSGEPIVGYTDVESPADGVLDLAGIDADEHQRLQLQARFQGVGNSGFLAIPNDLTTLDECAANPACWTIEPMFINEADEVVGTLRLYEQVVVRWTRADGLTLISPYDPNGRIQQARPAGLTDDGQVAGNYTLYDPDVCGGNWCDEVYRERGFVWDQDHGFRDIIELAGGVSTDGDPLLRAQVGGISEAGHVAGAVQLGVPGQINSGTWYTYVWSAGGGFRVNRDQGFLDGYLGRQFKVNVAGVVAGTAYFEGYGYLAAAWDSVSGASSVLYQSPNKLQVMGINARGTVIGIDNRVAWIVRDGQLTVLEPPPGAIEGTRAFASDLNDEDVAVGYYARREAGLDTVAWRWTPAGDLEVLAEQAAAADITPAGNILLVEIVPDPAAAEGRGLVWMSVLTPSGRIRLTAPSDFNELNFRETDSFGHWLNDQLHVIGIARKPRSRSLAGGVDAMAQVSSGTGFFWSPPDISTFALFGWQADYRSDRHPALELDAEVEETCRETITNRVEIGTSSVEVGVDNNRASVDVVVNRADLAIDVSAAARAVREGESLDFTFTWKNRGPGTARDVSVTARYPETGDTGAYSKVLIEGLTLGPGESGSAFHTLTNVSGKAGQDVAVSAEIASPTIDCASDNDRDTAAAVIGDYPNAWVRLDVQPGVMVGQAFPLRVRWGNDGNAAVKTANDVAVTLPEGLTVVDAGGAVVDGQRLVWTIDGKLPLGTNEGREVQLRFDACDTTRVSLDFTAEIRIELSDLDALDNAAAASATVVPPAAAMVIAGTSSRRVLRVGERVSAFVVFGNPGSALVRDPEVHLAVPAGLRVDGAMSPGVAPEAGGVVWTGEGLLPGAEGAMRVELVAEVAGKYALDLGASGQGACPVEGARIAIQVEPVREGPVVDVLAAADRPSMCATVGEALTWSFTVANHGTDPAPAFEVLSQVPPGLTVVAGTSTGAREVRGKPGLLRWTVGELAPGAALTLSYQGRVTDSSLLGRHALLASAEARFAVPGEPKPRVVSSAPALVTLGCDAGLVVEKRWTAGCALIGAPQGLEIRVRNAGTEAAEGVVLIDHMGAGIMGGLSPAPAVAGWDAGTRTLTRALGVIAPGAEEVIAIPLAIGADVGAGVPLYDVALVASENLPARLSNAVTGGVLACDDLNECTGNSCEPARGCVFDPVEDGAACDDEDACTTGDACAAGACAGGEPPDCDDDNACTVDGCEAASGCVYTDVADGNACDDGDLCTPGDICLGGRCAAGVAIACDTPGDCQEAGVCDPGTGVCTFAPRPDGTACQDGDVCTLRDACGGGVCRAGLRAFGECRCGDGWIMPGEACDDANTVAGDGCSESCAEEPGWVCFGYPPGADNVLPGGPCELFCGNRKLDPGETCDDGNASSGDGCSVACLVEPGYACAVTGELCTSVCGDEVRVYPEHCDDGNLVGGDGCSATCQVETGWDCAERTPCRPVCGDSVRTGGEACDDGNTRGDDGCSASCQPEAGWDCLGAGCVFDRNLAALDDVAETFEGQSVEVPVVLNDRGDDVRIADFGVAAHGDVERVDAFTVRYTPAPDFAGEDEFEYEIVDAAGESDAAVVVVTVIGVDAAQALRVTHVAQSCDPKMPGRQIDVAIIGGTGNYLLDLVPIPPVVRTVTPGKTAILHEISDLAATPRPVLKPVIAPVAEAPAVASLRTAPAPTEAVAVTPLKKSPIPPQTVIGNVDCPPAPKALAAVGDVATVIDGRAVIDVLANDQGTGLRLASLGTPANGEVTRGTGEGTIVYRPRAGWAGEDRFVYTVSDGSGQSDGAEVTVTVPATLGFDAVDDRAATVVGAEVLIDVAANDVGSASFQSLGNAGHGTATRRADGKISYVPSAGFVGEDAFSYRIGRNAASDEARVTVVVAGAGECVPFTVSEARATCQQAEGGQMPRALPGIITLRLYDVAFDVAGGSGRFLVNDVEGGPRYQSGPLPSGRGYRFSVSDAFNAESCAPVVVSGKVTCPASPDFKAVDDAYTTRTLVPVLLRPIENDLGTALSTGAIDAPQHGSLEPLGDGVYRYTSAAGFVGTETLGYSVRDAAGRRDGGTIKVVVGAHPPGVCADFAAEDLTAQCHADGSAYDVRFSIRGGSGVFEVGGEATDERAVVESVPTGKTFSVTIADRAAPCAPFTVVARQTCEASGRLIANPDAVTLAPSTTASFLPLDNDVGQGLVVTSIATPSHGVIMPRRGSYLYIPEPGFSGIDSAVYQVSDDEGASASSTVVFYVHDRAAEVAGCQSCALTAIDDRVTALVGDVVTRDLFANDLGPGLALVGYLGVTTNPVAIVAGRLTYRAEREVASERVMYQVRDAYGFVATASVLFSVGPAAPCLASPGAFLPAEAAACGGVAALSGFTRSRDYSVGVVATTPDGEVVAVSVGPVLTTPLPPGSYRLHGISWRTAGAGELPTVGGDLDVQHSCLAKSQPVTYRELAPIRVAAEPTCGAAGWDLELDVTGGEPELGVGVYTIMTDGAPPYDPGQSVGVWVTDEAGCEAVRYVTVPETQCDGGGP